MKLLKSQRLQPKYYLPIKRELEAVFYDILYKDIVALIKASTKQETKLNADVGALVEALRSGKVQYTQDNKGNGIFSGKFKASIGKQIKDLGGNFDSRSGIYRIAQALVPAEVKSVGALADQSAQTLHTELLKSLDKTQEGLDAVMETMTLNLEPTINAITYDFQSGLKSVAITPPVLTEASKLNLETDYTKNMKLYIKKWSEEHIEDLREVVQENSKQGYRFDNLIDRIKKAHGVSQSKATFLARQETSLFTSNYRKQRLGDIGIDNYKWSARSAALTRHDHWILHGKIYSYSNPPITNHATGARNNPGSDFGCLCADIPIIGRVEVAA